jgi:crotonobetainyl-CoA:carnitine CoA-transferase CaiB-like acyl-CoA transferase
MSASGEEHREPQPTPTPTGALDGIRVIEFATVFMGPYAGQMLGDLGADVIKVEELAGDLSRRMGSGPHPELSGTALNLHRNKRSIVLDCKSPAGRDAFLRLTATADVLVTNLRPGPLARLGLTEDVVRSVQPNIIFCTAQGFASDSHQADHAAFDDVIQAAAGMADLGASVNNGTPTLTPSVIADKTSALIIVQAVLAALLHRERTGEAQSIEVPMRDAVAAFVLAEHLSDATAEPPQGPPGYVRLVTPNRRPHRTLDGWIVMLPYSDADWRNLLELADRQDLLERPEMRTTQSRTIHADAVYGWLGDIVATKRTNTWLRKCEERGIAAQRVRPLTELADDPDIIEWAEHPVIGRYRHLRPAFRLSKTPARLRSPAPLIGQHTDEVLHELGYSAEQIADLRRPFTPQ